MTEARHTLRPATHWLLGMGWLVGFHLVGWWFLDWYRLDLGSVYLPTPRYRAAAMLWLQFGTLAVLSLAVALAASDRFACSVQWYARLDRRRFLVGMTLIGALIPAAVRTLLLRGMPLTDDEGAYRFAADLIQTGRLWVPSPPMKLFFDQQFFINDGRLYPEYFIGWPALKVLGRYVGLDGLLNSALSGLTVWPLLSSLERCMTQPWARAGVLLFLATPFVQVMAATGLSHTSCLWLLTIAFALTLRVVDGDRRVPTAAAATGVLAAAFTVRPQSTLAIGAPLGVALLVAALRVPTLAAKARRLLAMAVVASVVLIPFTLVLIAQNGWPPKDGYKRYAEYIAENGYRFTTYRPESVTGLSNINPETMLAAIPAAAVALARLNFDLFGWPSSLIVVGFAVRSRTKGIRLMWWMLGVYLVSAIPLIRDDWGIDTFGPPHAFELSLPLIGLTAAGAQALSARTGVSPLGRPWPATIAAALTALVVAAWLGFVPIRLRAVAQIAQHVETTVEAPGRLGLHRAVMFADVPFAPGCGGVPANFVLFRPPNDPDLRNDVIWANNVGPAENLQLAGLLNRRPFSIRWVPPCRLEVEPLTR